MVATKAAGNKPAGAGKKKGERKIEYPDYMLYDQSGDAAVDYDMTVKFMGFEQCPEGVKDFLFKEQGVAYRATHNFHNRRFDLGTCDKYTQDILDRQWAGPNGNGAKTPNPSHTIGLSIYGEVLTGQHTLSALFRAVLRYRSAAEGAHWKKVWGGVEPRMDCTLIVGVDPSELVTRTIDNVRPHTIADSRFAEGAYAITKADGQKVHREQRVRDKLTKIEEHAIRLMWSRTGEDKDSFAPILSHSEYFEWLGGHRKIEEAVAHIFEEYAGSKMAPSRMTPGYASALLYLMGASATDGVAYREAQERGKASEKLMDFSRWDKACEFWTLLAKDTGAGDFGAVVKAIAVTMDPDKQTGLGGRKEEKIAVIINAWKLFLAGKKLSGHSDKLLKELKPIYHPEERTNGIWGVDALEESAGGYPDVGGIDRPFVKKDTKPVEDDDDTVTDTGDADPDVELDGDVVEPTKDEVEARKAEIRRRHEAAKAEREKKPAPNTRLNGSPITAPSPVAETNGDVAEEDSASTAGDDVVVADDDAVVADEGPTAEDLAGLDTGDAANAADNPLDDTEVYVAEGVPESPEPEPVAAPTPKPKAVRRK